MKPSLSSDIIERARRKSVEKGPKTGKVSEDYDGPVKEGFRKRARVATKGDMKEFNDNLGPLERFLMSCAGRPWNDVWSEIRRTCDHRNVRDQHLIEHAYNMVDFMDQPRRYWRRDDNGIPYGLYVLDGILLYNPRKKYKYERPIDPNSRYIDGKHYVKRDDVWYEVIYREIESVRNSYGFCSFYDILEKESIICFNAAQMERRYPGGYPWKKRQLNKKEKKRLGL